MGCPRLRAHPWHGLHKGSSTSRGFHGLSRGFGVLRSPYGAHRHKSCWDDLSHGPACRCSNFFVGNSVAAPDIAQNSAAPARVEFCPITGAAHARAASATSTPCPPTLTSRPSFVVTVFLHMRPRRDGRELSCREKDSRRRTKFGREGAGTFQCPRPLYIGRNLTYPVPWHLSMPRAGPCKGPTTRSRVPHDRVRYALTGLGQG